MNPSTLSDEALKSELLQASRYAKVLRAERNRRERAKRPSRPKQGKGKSEAEKRQAKLYAEFREVHCDKCWNCGRREQDRPADYAGVFVIERAHITHPGLGRRCLDVRLIAALCTICHAAVHSGRGLTVAQLLALKREHDPDNYDPAFLQLHSVRLLEFPK